MLCPTLLQHQDQLAAVALRVMMQNISVTAATLRVAGMTTKPAFMANIPVTPAATQVVDE
jgi:hypothetical protein